MNPEQILTREELWELVINSANLTLKLLSRLQDEKHLAIQDAFSALKTLVELNPSVNTSKENSGHSNQIQSGLNQNPSDSNWLVLSQREVKIKLRGDSNNVVIARTVTTERELDILISKMYNSDVVALDCEFMTSKKSIPMLKVLQVAVSRSEGYAILIDKLNPDLIKTKLRQVLEDSTVNYVGWAFKGDALAISAAIADIQIAPVLDLQSKLRPIAVEKLNLFSGITKFAPDWEGLEEFQKAKVLGDGFIYHKGGCIWMADPLPASALVYAIFDVVSLIVLAESTTKYPTNQAHFWPLNLEEETPKAQNRYNKTLASINSSPNPGLQSGSPNLTTPVQQHSNNRSVSPQIKNRTVDANFSPKSSHVSYNQNHSPSIKKANIQNTTTHHYSTEAVKNESGIYFSPVQHKEKVTSSNQRSSWGEFSKQEHSTYLDKSVSSKTSNSTPPVKNASLSPRPPFKSPVSANQNIPSSQASPRKNEKAPATQPATTTDRVFDSKPDISKLKGDMRNTAGIISDQKVTFTNEENVPGGPEITVWNNFANSTIQEWNNRVDVGIEAFDEMKTSVSPKVSSSNIKPNASTESNHIADTPNNNISEWDKEDERPQYMQMKLNRIPMRHKFSGPKAVNPNDTDDSYDDDDDDADDSTGKVYKRSASDHLDIKHHDGTSSKIKPNTSQSTNFENKWQQIHNQNSPRSPQLLHQKTQQNHSSYGKSPDKSYGSQVPVPVQSKSPLLSHEPYHNDNSMQGIEVEDLSTYQESLYLYTGDNIKMCRISTPDELNCVIFPSLHETFTIAITFHYVSPNTSNPHRLKGIQVYFPDGDSYVVVVEQACFNAQITANSKIATLLTHPRINRVAWDPESAVGAIKDKTGISLGRTVDVCKKANSIGQAHGNEFASNLEFYLKDWPSLEQFNDEKEKYAKGVRKNFSSLWDREKLPMQILEYSTMVGAALYTLYQHPDLQSVSDEPYLFECH